MDAQKDILFEECAYEAIRYNMTGAENTTVCHCQRPDYAFDCNGNLVSVKLLKYDETIYILNKRVMVDSDNIVDDRVMLEVVEDYIAIREAIKIFEELLAAHPMSQPELETRYWINDDTGRVLIAIESPGNLWSEIDFETYDNLVRPGGKKAQQ